MNRETPRIIDAGHSHTIYGLGNMNQGQLVAGTTASHLFAGIAQGGGWVEQTRANSLDWQYPVNDPRRTDSANWGKKEFKDYLDQAEKMKVQPKKETEVTRRLVQVIIVDPNENLALEDSLLYKGEQKLTDLTDQELFFEIDIKSLLDAHNAKRIKMVDKKVKDRIEYLEPARIRDLKMVVVTIAQF